jgi:hypothetical protein
VDDPGDGELATSHVSRLGPAADSHEPGAHSSGFTEPCARRVMPVAGVTIP